MSPIPVRRADRDGMTVPSGFLASTHESPKVHVRLRQRHTPCRAQRFTHCTRPHYRNNETTGVYNSRELVEPHVLYRLSVTTDMVTHGIHASQRCKTLHKENRGITVDEKSGGQNPSKWYYISYKPRHGPGCIWCGVGDGKRKREQRLIQYKKPSIRART